jgi:hypothetical protein
MNNKEEIVKTQINAKDSIIDWNIWDAILLAFIVVYVILVPIGGFHYFCGWYNPYLLFYIACFVFPIMTTISILLLLYTVIWTFRLLINWTKYTRKKKFIRIIHVCIPLVFIGSFLISIFTHIDIPLCQFGYKSFTYGFRERIKSKADIEDIQNWVGTLQDEDCTGETIDLFRDADPLKSQWPDSIEWPKSLKVFNPRFVNLDFDKNRNPKVRLTWCGIFVDWGVVIGMENMEIPPSDFSRWEGEYRLPLGPGAYVWHDLE